MKARAKMGLVLSALAAGPVGAAELAPVPVADPGVIAWWLVAVPALGLWAVFALAEARRSDANFTRRMARRRLARLTARMSRGRGEPSLKDIEQWRREFVTFLAIPRAAPTEVEVRAALAVMPEVAAPEAWCLLWGETQAALFGPSRRVPADWLARAVTAVERTRVRRAASIWPHRARHWLPRVGAAMAVLAFHGMPVPVEAQEAEIAAGDWFASWRQAQSLAEDGQWPAAQARATVAFVLAPREAGVRATLQRSVAESERADPLVVALLERRGAARWAGLASPGEWQRLEWLGQVVSALALVVVVIMLYQPRRGRWIAVTGVLAGLSLAGAAVWARQYYGLAAAPTAGCLVRPTDLRDVPSDLVEIRQAAPLSAGTLVRIDGSYFGWVRIVGRGDLVGWVRRDAVLPLYGDAAGAGATGFAVKRP